MPNPAHLGGAAPGSAHAEARAARRLGAQRRLQGTRGRVAAGVKACAAAALSIISGTSVCVHGLDINTSSVCLPPTSLSPALTKGQRKRDGQTPAHHANPINWLSGPGGSQPARQSRCCTYKASAVLTAQHGWCFAESAAPRTPPPDPSASQPWCQFPCSSGCRRRTHSE